jgi:hypothetical protein
MLEQAIAVAERANGLRHDEQCVALSSAARDGETCNFSVAWSIGVCDHGLRFAVQKLCTGLPTKSVEKADVFRDASTFVDTIEATAGS